MTTLLVTSAGGHLRQMWTLHRRFDVAEDVVWATAPTAQSESLLAGQRVVDLPPTPSRDLVGAFRLVPVASRIIRQYGVSRVVSTGALPAVPFFLAARQARIPCHYIESAARFNGPSLTGRLVSRIPGVELYSQYPSWAHGRWRFRGSVLDGFEPGGVELAAPWGPLSVVVTLGVEHFGFRRALEKLIEVLPADSDVVWQTGHTDASGLRIDARPFIPATELEDKMARADVVVAHSGVGSALTAMAQGRYPVLLPRHAQFGEHVDDHQTEIADELARRGVAIKIEVADLTLADLQAAAVRSVRRVAPEMFHLAERRPGARVC